MRVGVFSSFLLGGILITLTALTGSSDAVDSWNIQDNYSVPVSELTGMNSVGQTFIFRYRRLHSIQVWFSLSDDLEYTSPSFVTLHVRRRVDDPRDLVSASLPVSAIQNHDFTKFDFSPIEDSEARSFYFFVDISHAKTKSGNISIWSSDSDDYADGEMYIDGAPTNRDLAFRAFYEPDLLLAIRPLEKILRLHVFDIPFVLLLLISPGVLLLSLLGGFENFKSFERIGLAIGLSLAFLSAGSMLLLWLGLAVQFLALFLVILLFVFMRVGGRQLLSGNRRSNPEKAGFAIRVLVVLAALSFAVALIQIRDTVVPLWVDSPIHAENIREIIDQGHLPVYDFYHFGYHSLVALIVQLSSLSIPQAMLMVGQLLITQTGFSIFLLSKRLTGSDIAALVSASCVWFFSPFPSYFATWGRYPLLMGVALLPIVLLCTIELIEHPRFNFRILILAIMTCVGLAFSQIRLIAFYLIFVLVYLVYSVRQDRTRQYQLASLRVGTAMGVTLLFGILWLAAVLPHVDWQVILARNAEMASGSDIPTISQIILSHHGLEFWLLTFPATILAIPLRLKGSLIIIAWYLALAGISAVLEIVIGREYLPLSLLMLVGFLPASVVVGDLINCLYTKTVFESLKRINLATAVWLLTLVVTNLIGARDMISIVNPATILFSGADEDAMVWIKENSEIDSKFLVNSFLWSGSTYRSSDGGSWIPFLTGRPVELPNFTRESGTLDSETLATWISQRQIRFVYLGSRSGILRGTDFSSQPNRYKAVYNRAGIRIFSVIDASDQPSPQVP